MEVQKTTTYKLDESQSQVEESVRKTDQTANLGLLKFSSKFKPNSNFQFNYDVFLKQSDDDEKEDLTSSVNDKTEEIGQIKSKSLLQ